VQPQRAAPSRHPATAIALGQPRILRNRPSLTRSPVVRIEGRDEASAAGQGSGECCAAAKCSNGIALTRPQPTRTGLLACGTDLQRPPCPQMVRRGFPDPLAATRRVHDRGPGAPTVSV
jgi:hypothetical protein